MKEKIVDHLFRHQYGKMVAILTHIFGLSNIETIEDAVQDTFVRATLQWRNELPENPEAWLTQAAKNRVIDLLRKVKAEKNRFEKVTTGAASIHLNELFLDHEVEDSQLRMIFVACHPDLSPQEQVAFALKTISGFSMNEIAAALLTKPETIKKRLVRARKTIQQKKIQFAFPGPGEVESRLVWVQMVIYLIFNEGFHSTKPDQLISKDLCGEALRLCKLLLNKSQFRSGSLYALFALLCFHSARLESKINAAGEIVDLEHQDRSLWYFPLVELGNDAMNKAMEYPGLTAYHYEASIAAEHLKSKDFLYTNWNLIAEYYDQLYVLQPNASTRLGQAIVTIQLGQWEQAGEILESINLQELGQRAYLWYGTYADLYTRTGNLDQAVQSLEAAIQCTSNTLEKAHLSKKKEKLEGLASAL